MITNFLNSKSATAYAPAIVAKRVEAAGNGVSTNVSGQRAFDLAATAYSKDKSAVSKQLNDQQRKLAGELTDGIQAAKQNLEGGVTFTLDGSGKLSVDGTAGDKAKVSQYLDNDTSLPSLANRLTSMLQGAHALGAASVRGGGSSTVITPPIQGGPATPTNPDAALTVSSAGSSLAYAGALDVDA